MVTISGRPTFTVVVDTKIVSRIIQSVLFTIVKKFEKRDDIEQSRLFSCLDSGSVLGDRRSCNRQSRFNVDLNTGLEYVLTIDFITWS